MVGKHSFKYYLKMYWFLLVNRHTIAISININLYFNQYIYIYIYIYVVLAI